MLISNDKMSKINLNQQNNVVKCTPEKSNILNSKKNLVLWKMIFFVFKRWGGVRDLPQGKREVTPHPRQSKSGQPKFRRFNEGFPKMHSILRSRCYTKKVAAWEFPRGFSGIYRKRKYRYII